MTISDDYQKEVIALRNRIIELEGLVRDLSYPKVVAELNIVQHYKLTLIEARLLACLASGGLKSKDVLLTYCCGESVELVGLHMHRIRHKAPDLDIITYHGIGYALEGESLARVRAIAKGSVE